MAKRRERLSQVGEMWRTLVSGRENGEDNWALVSREGDGGAV